MKQYPVSEDLWQAFESGEWLRSVIDDEEVLKKAALHFQEMWNLYQNITYHEEVQRIAEEQRVTELINQDPELAVSFKEKGWKVTKRTNKKVDMNGFIEDYGEEIPRDAIAVVKSKLTPHLKKELTKYESITGYTFSAKR